MNNFTKYICAGLAIAVFALPIISAARSEATQQQNRQ